MVKNIIHNVVFRIFTPIFYGVTVYILILLIFDTIEQLSENFFSFQVAVILIITYLVFELLRWYAKLIEKKCPLDCSIIKRILIHSIGSIVIAVVVTSIIISFYFSQLIGFKSYGSELAVFNSIFILTSIIYNMIYFSFFYLNRINVEQLEQENILRSNAEIELDTYKNKINPDFLYDSLETLMSLSKQDVEKADRFILKLSDVYRNILSTKNSEKVQISEEIKISETLVEILNYKNSGNINLEVDTSVNIDGGFIISGTLVVIIEDIVNRSIISEIQPLNIDIKIEDEVLIVSHKNQTKLIQVFSKKTELKHLKSAYLLIGKQGFEVKDDDVTSYRIPVFKKES